MSEITWAGVNSNIPKQLPYADEVDMEVLWSLYKLVETELNLISKARHAEISKGDIDNPNIKPMNLEFGRLRNWLDEISNHLDIDYWVEHDKHYEAYLRYRAGAWNEGHAAKGFMEWVAETIGVGKPATAPTAAAQGEVCRCGYPMADHDADGQCPGDGYLGQDDDEPFELGIHRMIPGLWRLSHVDGVASMELVAEEATDPKAELQKLIDKGLSIDAIKLYRKMYDSDLYTARDAVLAMKHNKPTYAELAAALQQAQRERDAALAREKMLLASLHNIRDMRVNPTGDSKYDEGRQMGYQITTELAQAAINAHAKAASAQQAAQPADGEG